MIFESDKLKGPSKTRNVLMTHIRMVVPNTTEAVYSLAKKTLVFLKFRSFVKQLIYDYVNLEVLTSGLVILSERKSPFTVASTPPFIKEIITQAYLLDCP